MKSNKLEYLTARDVCRERAPAGLAERIAN
jgi:hypothetical protein